MRTLAIASMILLGSVLAPSRASALSCAPRTAQQQLDASTVVFVGRVVQRKDRADARLVTFAVSRSFKGTKAGETLKVWTETSKYQWPFLVGDEYLVFVRPFVGSGEGQADVSTLWTFVCMGDLKLAQAPEETRRALDELEAVVRGDAGADADAAPPSVASASPPPASSASSASSAPPPPPPPVHGAPRSGCGVGASSEAPWPAAIAAILALGSRRKSRKKTV